MQNSSFVRPLARRIGRELSESEIGSVSGAGTTYYGTVCTTLYPGEGMDTPVGDDTGTRVDP